MHTTIKKNVNLMTLDRRGGMKYLLIGESVGGNAGKWKGYTCAGANFYYDGITGEIKYFGNVQDVPQEIKEHFNAGTFRVAMDVPNTVKNRIVEFMTDAPLTENAKRMIDLSIAEYNQVYGF
jgi:hypothetical protein